MAPLLKNIWQTFCKGSNRGDTPVLAFMFGVFVLSIVLIISGLLK